MTSEEKRRFLARRALETEQRRAIFNAETGAETTEVRFQNYFMNKLEGGGSIMLPALYTLSSLRF